jgi:hypothetical protein
MERPCKRFLIIRVKTIKSICVAAVGGVCNSSLSSAGLALDRIESPLGCAGCFYARLRQYLVAKLDTWISGQNAPN